MECKPVQIIIVHDGGEHVMQTVTTCTILQLKMQISVDLHIPEDEQSLRFNGEFLKNERRVGDYRITEGAMVLLQLGIPILIKTTSTEFWLLVENTISVAELKEKIRVKTGIEQMRLVVGNREMFDYIDLQSYRIHEGSEIEVIVPLVYL